MASLVRTKCPHCSAPLKIDPALEQVTCDFCHNSALVTRKDRPPTRTAATMHLKTIDLDAAARFRRIIVTIVVVTIAVPVLSVVTCVAVFVYKASKVADQAFGEVQRVTKDVSKALNQANARGSQRPVRSSPKPNNDDVRLQAADLSKVDGMEIYRQALAAARRIDRHAQLSSLTFPKLTGGTVDVAAGAGARFWFDTSHRDPTKPPGADRVRGGIMGSLLHGAFALHALPTERPGLPPPRCSTRALWKEAVRSGVPHDTVAQLDYRRRSPRHPVRWSLTVVSYPKLNRVFDAKTCKVRRR